LDEFSELYEAAAGKVRMVTLAPEQPKAIPLIETLVEQNVVPALGHHQADRATLDAAIDAGAKICTHLGNGCHATMHRLDNYVWEQLGEDRLWASFIPDGHHIPPSTLRCMLRAKGPSRSVLTTDAVACAGLPPGDYELLGQPVTLHPDGRMCLTGTPYFAGSAVTMPVGISIAVRHTDLSLTDALDLVVRQPLRLFSQPNAEDRLAPGQPTDLIQFTWDESACQMTVKLAALANEIVVNS
jgi:N-acetylglucosamine-6-phosphate deacetylase